ncbi:NAD(P)H-binding protein [Microbacterium sp. LRZ72]|uniref:NAD(P)-dependent oxidoreductase n=1 Tax=Microbacterium sp. LRZ72 TaxID=2942481 RepID=UPI0029AABEAE|nr:NAD(P)H-binding protein [Microbacterium sp. LRZ72]MDX2376170.1 NAD(P)H-binding protein [Microbacterium sp. LRZ72]
MARITILGGSGYAGSALVAEAARRGHDVTSVSRTTPEERVAGVDYVAGDVVHRETLTSVIEGRDAVVVALSPRGDMVGKVEGVLEDLIRTLEGTDTRLGYIGGASSLHLSEGGPTLWDVSHEQLPPEVKPEIETGLHAFDMLKASPESLDWFYVSPPSDFGSWLGTASRGSYVLGGDVLLKDDEDASTISADDLALAIIDEVEQPKHRRGRFTAIWGPKTES